MEHYSIQLKIQQLRIFISREKADVGRKPGMDFRQPDPNALREKTHNATTESGNLAGPTPIDARN